MSVLHSLIALNINLPSCSSASGSNGALAKVSGTFPCTASNLTGYSNHCISIAGNAGLQAPDALRQVFPWISYSLLNVMEGWG